MIVLHRLGHPTEPFHLNPDLIVTVEDHPDTVVTLVSGTKIVVHESADGVSEIIRAYRVGILTQALGETPARPATAAPEPVRRPHLTAVEDATPTADQRD